ncbi:MAG: hypothetical protein ACK5KT_05440 [Dysgonomonas sp.]
MNISKYICILCAFMLLPLFVKAQIIKPVTKRQAKQIGKDIYITSSGDTTLIVNAISKGLKTPETKFLFRNKKDAELDSIFSDKKSDYISLETATLDINRLIREIETEQKMSRGNNDALSFRLSSKNRDMRKKELEAREISDEIARKDYSVQELAALYAMFGDKPTYYINGIEVPATIANQLYPSEILEKTMRVADTASGNPNGEIWYKVAEKALKRIKLPVNMAYDSGSNATVYTEAGKDLSTYIKEVEKIERERSKANLKSQPVIKRERTPDGKQIDKVVLQPDKSSDDNEGNQTIDKVTYGTRVISRTVNNQRTDTNEENQAVSPTSRTPIPVVRKSYNEENSQPTTSTKKQQEVRKIEPEVKEEKEVPKKSVKRIKERHQSQNEDDTETIQE